MTKRMQAGLCALALAAVLATSPTALAESVPVVSFSGTGDRTTESFQVDDGWAVEWTTDDERFQATLRDTLSGIPSLTANPVDPGSGRVVYARGGTFQFEVETEGSWTIEVFDLR